MPQLFRFLRLNMMAVPAVFAVSILIAILWDPWMAMWSWLLLVPVQMLAGRLGGRARATADPASSTTS